MSKNVVINETEYSGVSRVQFATVGGGTALFRDEDEISGAESGVFVPMDNNKTITIPVSSKKENISIYANAADVLETNAIYANIGATVLKGNGMFYMITNAAGTGTVGYTVVEDSLGVEGTSGKIADCVFNDDSITITSAAYNKNQYWATSFEYTWHAW